MEDGQSSGLVFRSITLGVSLKLKTGTPIFDIIIFTVIESSKIGMKIALDITNTHYAIGSHMTESIRDTRLRPVAV